MRKAIFAVMLIGASFAGGAVVNGPGLRWAQDMILSHLNGDSEEDESSDTEETTASAEEAKSKSDDQEPPAQLLSAPLSLDEALASSRAASEKGSTEGKDKDDTTEATTSRSRSEAGPAEAKTAAGDRGKPSAGAASSQSKSKSEESGASGALKLLGDAFRRKQSPSDDGEIALVNVPTPLPDGATPPPLEPLDPLPPPNQAGTTPEPPAKGDTAAATDRDKNLALAGASTTGSPPPRSLDPAPAPTREKTASVDAGASAASTSEPASAPGSRPVSDWTEIRRKMAALGVSRYGIEGEPNGRVRFHCVIPLAGRRAVAQQFEAEGDDEFQAAEVALRRVALWRATENPGP